MRFLKGRRTDMIATGIGLLAIIQVFEALAKVGLSIFFVNYYQSIIGVAIGTAIPMVIARGFILPTVVSRQAGVRVASYYKCMVPAAVVAAMVVLVCWYFAGDMMWAGTDADIVSEHP